MPAPRLWLGRAIWLALALTLVFLRLLPLETVPRAWTGPDLLLAVTLAWTVRQPRLVPVLMIAGVFLLCDLLFDRPPGLEAGLVVMATEVLRRRSAVLRNAPLLAEWAAVSACVLAVTLAARVIAGLAVLPVAPLGLDLIQAAATILAYPLVAGIAHLVFGITRRPWGEAAGVRT
ncbi:rod shape-determining protein MreD [Pseudoroseicyclus aestuarii]|uniref:Rod shape-determining protein MreD n=1 Tax=Pseudoroseicyclus aestuarii TaxID=1795041 RepID=A0A318SQ06_9RHOB|nr:rod shape-determining protein MreD [Pseudoroseicyclus aestuarii]